MVLKQYKNINLDYLDMMADGDEDMRKTMLGMLLDELPTEMKKMRQCTDTADWAEMREVSHKMKSTMAFIGNDLMTNANKEIEAITKDGGDVRKIAGLMEIMETNCILVMQDLQDCLA